jgi:hypothetical protein
METKEENHVTRIGSEEKEFGFYLDPVLLSECERVAKYRSLPSKGR